MSDQQTGQEAPKDPMEELDERIKKLEHELKVLSDNFHGYVQNQKADFDFSKILRPDGPTAKHKKSLEARKERAKAEKEERERNKVNAWIKYS